MHYKIKFLVDSQNFKAFRLKSYSRLSLNYLGYSFFLKPKSSLVRLKRRCFLTGTARSHVRYFGLSRHSFRKLALDGRLLGVRKSSF